MLAVAAALCRTASVTGFRVTRLQGRRIAMAAGAAVGGPDARPKIVVVVGATGTGKTRLGVELAKAFNGEVVNADAMQMYKGLDIVTAKITKEEMDGVPHHLLDWVDPLTRCTVHDFKARATAAIQDILSRNRLPIVVGGTAYYVQALIRNLVVEESIIDLVKSKGPLVEPPPLSLPPYDRLKAVDPIMAQRLHPADERKIARALQVVDTHHVLYSQVLQEQAEQLQHQVAPYKTCLLWVNADTSALDPRLDARVDKMVQLGLVAEIQSLWEVVKQTEGSVPESKDAPEFEVGLLQAIGFKEFAQYLHAVEKGESKDQCQSLFTVAVDTLKQVTRAYVRRQIRFIKNRLQERGVPLLRLDSTDPTKWTSVVYEPAAAQVRALLADELPDVPLDNDAKRVMAWTKYECSVCNRVLNGEHEWKEHQTSRSHKRQVAYVARQKEAGAAAKRQRVDRAATDAAHDDSKHE